AKTESLWTDNSDGTYSRTYIAKTAGTGLKVRVQLAGWESAAESPAYSVAADTASAALGADDLTVLTGNRPADGTSENRVQAVVRDAQGNTLSGVKVAFTADSGAEPASQTVTTGTDGSAVFALKNSTAGSVTVKAYIESKGADTAVSVTVTFAGDEQQLNSVMRTDRRAYTAGDDITVTVTLKDSGNRPVSGKESVLTAGTLTAGNASLKSGSSWTESGSSGEYSITYVAGTAGTGLKAVFRAAGWASDIESDTYTITAAAATAALGADDLTVLTDNRPADGVSENRVQAVVKDAQGNTLSGMKVVFTADNSASPASQTVTTGADGSAVFALKSSTAGSVTVKAYLEDKGAGTAVSRTVTFSGDAAQTKSAISTDKTAYTAGDEMTVKVTLKDTQKRGVSGKGSLLTDSAVTVANAAAKAESWTDNGDGTYSRTYTAGTAGTGLKAKVQLAGWESAAESAAYSISAGSAAPAESAAETDETAYTAGDEM
ncbi:Ig-like domain-containing protein, partial [Morganella morganii]|uniref:Ig-like domain-containing protein n=1 Tax=Morganella morganii TaxID=582 RepID=UPI003EBEDE07